MSGLTFTVIFISQYVIIVKSFFINAILILRGLTVIAFLMIEGISRLIERIEPKN